ncbi:hypothetical protein [Streptomyces sp. LaPpAH-108]|uniref:hypothetical protein n=1 Tax=Streptomyces sp. LaPpAH-108 TaxID=1155714 RepID=UPI0003787596
MAWIVAVVLLAEGCVIAAFNWFLGMVADRQHMSLAGIDPDLMSVSSKIGGVVFGLYFALCALVALLVAVRDRAPAGFGRILLISAAVVHALLGAAALALTDPAVFVTLMVTFALLLLLLMTYDAEPAPAARATDGGDSGKGDGTATAEAAPQTPAPVIPAPRTEDRPGRAPFTRPAPTTP